MKKCERRGIESGLPILCLPFILGLFICIILLVSGTATLSISGFAVDDCERLYVGTAKAISVYEDGKLAYEIDPQTSRTYRFTVDDNGNLLLSTSTKIYIMDLEGNILETKEDAGADTYNQLSYRKNKFVSKKGDEYRLINFGRAKIVKNGTQTIYQIDDLSFSVMVSTLVCTVGLLLFLLLGLINRNKKNRLNNLQ